MSLSIKSLLSPSVENADYLNNCLNNHPDSDGVLGLHFDCEAGRCDEREYIHNLTHIARFLDKYFKHPFPMPVLPPKSISIYTEVGKCDHFFHSQSPRGIHKCRCIAKSCEMWSHLHILSMVLILQTCTATRSGARAASTRRRGASSSSPASSASSSCSWRLSEATWPTRSPSPPTQHIFSQTSPHS